MLSLSMPDGDANAFSVRDSSTGVDLTRVLGVVRVELAIEAGEPVRASFQTEVLNVDDVGVDPANARWVARNPRTDRLETLRALEFASGLRIEFPDGIPVVRDA